MKYTTVLIDIDDTLIDTAGITIETLNEIYVDYKLSNYFDSLDNFMSIFQANNKLIWQQYEQNQIGKDDLVRRRFLVPFQEVKELSEEAILKMNDDYTERIVSKKKLIDGAKDILDYLHAKYQICAISNGFTEMQFRKIETAGFSTYFNKIILSDSIGINKPHPDIFKYALQMAEVSKEKTIMIGDNYNSDIVGAYNSGIDQIWYQPQGKQVINIEPTFIIKSLYEIKDLL